MHGKELMIYFTSTATKTHQFSFSKQYFSSFDFQTDANTQNVQKSTAIFLQKQFLSNWYTNKCNQNQLVDKNCTYQNLLCKQKAIAIWQLLSRRSTGDGHVHLFVCLSVCLSLNCKNAIFSKTTQFRVMVSIDVL